MHRPLRFLELVVVGPHAVDQQALHQRTHRAVALVMLDEPSLQVTLVGYEAEVGHDHVDRQDALGGADPSPYTGYMA